MNNNTHREIRVFIEQILSEKGDSVPVGNSESLVLSGRLESIDAVRIVMFLESRFGLNFAEIGFDEAQIDSIQLIENLVQTHTVTERS